MNKKVKTALIILGLTTWCGVGVVFFCYLVLKILEVAGYAYC